LIITKTISKHVIKAVYTGPVWKEIQEFLVPTRSVSNPRTAS